MTIFILNLKIIQLYQHLYQMQNIASQPQNLFLSSNYSQSSFQLIVSDDLPQELKTPQKRKNQEKQFSTTTHSNIYLTPLVPAAKLNFWSGQLQQTLDLEMIQTPCRNKLNSINSMIDQDTHDSKPMYSIQTKDLFENQDIDEYSNESVSPFGEESEKQNYEDEQNLSIDSEKFQELNQQKQHLNHTSFPKNQKEIDSFNLPKEDSDSKKLSCNCKKTKCLKLYCDCFREGQGCGQACQCLGCHNTQQYNAERVDVKQLLNKRNSQAFRPKIEGKQHSKGCNCKQTHCLKKYCECFQAGIGCGQHCKCEQCQNAPGQVCRDLKTAKKERKMREY